MGISAEFSVDQLDVLPSSPDPFAATRTSDEIDLPGDGELLDGDDGRVLADDEVSVVESAEPVLPPRARLPPVRLADFQIGAMDTSLVVPSDLLQGPVFRPRTVEVDGRSVTLVERPVAFLSRLTTVAEKRLVAPELELSCLAWAFGQWAHLLEGAPVLVITDHAPMAAMLTSASSTRYGPTITKCRALLLPHLHNLRFEHRAGRSHTNVDSLSRLIAPETIEDAVGPPSPTG
ncbi:hypothetical protein A4X09_0g5244 [Tilletia walkeri]|uniref:Reverse transcriptase RNase H-like domain-containing protein n=1 Tax=Tilletia walkeri TaxID=117179 RepID=A0A8X7N4T3_9BASI|nr:hypothetical protein A4X09_0g5244 [Tilletia walkeri]